MNGIDPDELLLAYRLGVFPMAESRAAPEVLWVRPSTRCILPLDDFHVPKRLARTIRSDRFDVRRDTAFSDLIRACAATGARRNDTWINPAIVEVFEILHARGFAHSIEAWEDDVLVGGLYGLALGGVFFGESMFSARTDASKVALVHLVARLKSGGYKLLDAQFPNPHLHQFGAVEIDERDFEHILEIALAFSGDFYWFDGSVSAPAGSSAANGSAPGSNVAGSGGGASVMQVITQTS